MPNCQHGHGADFSGIELPALTDLISNGYAPDIAHLMRRRSSLTILFVAKSSLRNAHVIGADTSERERADDLLEEDYEWLSSPALSGPRGFQFFDFDVTNTRKHSTFKYYVAPKTVSLSPLRDLRVYLSVTAGKGLHQVH
jgi:hypothetical protein